MALSIKPYIENKERIHLIGIGGVSMSALGELLRERWNLSALSLHGNLKTCVRRVALGGGACMDFWPEALALGVQCFITADVSYHPREEAQEAGLSVAACDHGEMERVSLPALAALVAEQTGLPVTLLEGADADTEDGLGGR